jgi:hypothetical protein
LSGSLLGRVFVGIFNEFLCNRNILCWSRSVELLCGKELLAKGRGDELVLGKLLESEDLVPENGELLGRKASASNSGGLAGGIRIIGWASRRRGRGSAA